MNKKNVASRCEDVTYENINLRPAGPPIPQRAGAMYRMSRWPAPKKNDPLSPSGWAPKETFAVE